MLKLLVDEHIARKLVQGLLRKEPRLDVVRVQEVGLRRALDPDILEWAASEGRVLVTFDVKTVPAAAYSRAAEGQHMPGVFAITESTPLGVVIEQLLVLAIVSLPNEWEGQVVYLPL